MKNIYLYALTLLFSSTVLVSCKGKKNAASSSKTGYAYNKQSPNGFEVNNKFKRDGNPGAGLVAIEGGEFIMGGSAVEIPGQDLTSYNYKRQVTISSFYMDETEVSNTDWLEYMYWIRQNFPADAEAYYNAIPDTLVWRRPLSLNEPYVDNYLRHPAYKDYPVVGVSWLQTQDYCVWRTDRVNEMLLRKKGIMNSFAVANGTSPNNNAAATTAGGTTAPNSNAAATTAGGTTATKSDKPFNTSSYLNNQNDDKGPKAFPNLNPNNTTGAKRNARLEDGILKQPYRLPTEAEWEYAALALAGNTKYENISEKKIYPWNGLGISSPKKSTRGRILANFKRGKGDYMGVGGNLNDKAAYTEKVRSFEPNDFGLYNMAGNVNEWVADVYRTATFEQADALNPFRGNFYQNKDRNASTGAITIDKYGRPVMVNANAGVKQTWAQLQATKTTAPSDFVADKRGYRDEQTAQYGITTLVNDKSRVYKGGSWDDQANWLNPASRRHLQEDESSADIGFRCAMTMLGSAEVRSAGKPQFKVKNP